MTALPACCMDLRINPIHLIFPEQMSLDGREFIEAHGLDQTTLWRLRFGARLEPDGSVLIRHRCQHLQGDGQCSIYSRRPAICREFDCSARADHCVCQGKGKMPGGDCECLS